MFPGQSLSGNCHHQPPDGSGSMTGSIGSGCRRSMTTAAADEEETEPPASVLTRRRALVPPKIPPYNMDSSEDTEQSADKETSTRLVGRAPHTVVRHLIFIIDLFPFRRFILTFFPYLCPPSIRVL